MVLTEYTLTTDKIKHDHTFVMLSDFHNREKYMADALRLTCEVQPDAIFVVGDLVDRHKKIHDLAVPFLQECVKTAPTFFSYGNHEKKYPAVSEAEFISSGAVVLNNSFVEFQSAKGDTFIIGGHFPYTGCDWVSKMEKAEEYKILLCHHPEYYKKLSLCDREIDLMLSGHAHGGQIRLFGRGILSPNQGLFPKYTSGIHDNKLIVGTGIANTGGIIPRLWNPTEVLKITLLAKPKSP